MSKKFFKKAFCNVLILLLIVGCSSSSKIPKGEIIESVELNKEQTNWLTQNINEFNFRSAPLVISSDDLKNKNILYSPVSLYFALSMMYELADIDSETKKEIENNLQPISKGVQADMSDLLFQNLVHNNNTGSLKLTNQIIKKEGINFPDALSQLIDKKYHATLSNFTKKDIEDYLITPDTLAIIINSIEFDGLWKETFNKQETKKDIFKSDDGEIECEFMNKEFKDHKYITSTSFMASSIEFLNGYAIHFILPNEGISPIELINKPDALKIAIDYSDTNNERINAGSVKFKIPKIKFESNMELNETIKKLGMNSAYDSGFTVLDQLDLGIPAVDRVTQSSVFEINEEGAKAKSKTKIYMTTKSEPSYVDLNLTRPFLIEITSKEGYVLFTGLVNRPN